MKEIINNISGSLKTKDSKWWSARKLAAFTVIWLVVVLHIKWFKSEHWEYISTVLIADFTFILTCLGLTTWEIIKDKEIKPKIDDNNDQ